MIGLAVVAAVIASIGGLMAVSARDGRLVALGLLVAMIAAPLAASPQPPVLAIAFRILGALLAGYLIWAATRARSIESEGTGIGAVSEVVAAAAAFGIGWFVTPVKPLAGPIAAQAAGIALVALAVVPLLGRNILRLGAGMAVLTLGISLLLQAWVGPASSLQQIVLMALLVGILGATSLLISPIRLPAARRVAAAQATDDGGLVDTAGSGEEVEPGSSEGPASPPAEAPVATAPEVSPEVAPEVAAAAAPEVSPAAATAAAPRRSTVRTPAARSPRTVRRAAPSKSPAEAAPPPPEDSEGPKPVSTRTRRLRPREPREPRG
jgi:hypothetical protein